MINAALFFGKNRHHWKNRESGGYYTMISLPLFPLPLAVCPREFVPLHIFEHRYKVMVSDCLQKFGPGRGGEFVVCYSGCHGPSPVGTVVKLIKVLKTHDDGRIDIVALGQRRVSVCECASDHAYQMANCDAHEDVVSDWDDRLATTAFELHRRLIQVITGRLPSDSLYAGVQHLSFLLASTLCFQHAIKQRLIASQDENERLAMLITIMSDLMRKIALAQASGEQIQDYWQLQAKHGPGSLWR